MTMKCSDAHKLMGDYLEGILAPEESGKLRDHLESCEDCKELLEDFEDIALQARELPRLEPSDAAWPAILRRVREARTETAAPLAPRKKWFGTIFAPGRSIYAGAAALLLLAVVGGLIIGRRPANGTAGLSEPDRYTLAKVEEAEKYYKLAIQALSEAVGSPKNGLDPQVAAVFERNLREIDGAIQACQKAVAKAPSDLAARVYLLGAYKNKVEFLDNVIEVKKNSPSVKTNGATI
jgi:tetratricopeptide (TPR) repeat protein